MQALTGVISTLFVLGTFYRSASLYHPQRRAILHLKSQKRKIKSKDKEKTKTVTNSHEDTPPFFDFSTLKSRTVQILLLSTSMAGLGLNTPLLFMVTFKIEIAFKQRFFFHCKYFSISGPTSISRWFKGQSITLASNVFWFGLDTWLPILWVCCSKQLNRMSNIQTIFMSSSFISMWSINYGIHGCRRI